jgi:hypothetical protein
MTESNQSHANDVEQEALSGRLPVLASERVYGRSVRRLGHSLSADFCRMSVIGVLASSAT